MVDHKVYALRSLTNDDLLAGLAGLVLQERESVADITEHLIEIDRRDLPLEMGYSSLFEYCVGKLDYSRQAAYFRIRAARAADK